jgi:hypothetical protein
VRSSHTITSRTWRWSLLGRPVVGRCGGNSGLSTAPRASVSSRSSPYVRTYQVRQPLKARCKHALPAPQRQVGRVDRAWRVRSTPTASASDRQQTVHHRDGNRSRNTIGNLELWTGAQPSGQRGRPAGVGGGDRGPLRPRTPPALAVEPRGTTRGAECANAYSGQFATLTPPSIPHYRN